MNPEIKDYWIARIQYWPTAPAHYTIIQICHVRENGEIDFIPFSGMDEGDPIRSSQCEKFELLERIEVEKYK